MSNRASDQLSRCLQEVDEFKSTRYVKRAKKTAVHMAFLFAKFWRHVAALVPEKPEIEEISKLDFSRRMTAVVNAAVKAFWETPQDELPMVPGRAVYSTLEICRKLRKEFSAVAERSERMAEKFKARQEKKAV